MNRGLLFGIWLAATIMFRFAGHLFFLINNAVVMIALWIMATIALPSLALFIFRQQKITPEHRYEVVVWLVVPGMVGDALTTQFFGVILPNMDLAADGPFAAWLLWSYAVVLITGLWAGSHQTSK